jgi:hypothetical protein
MEVITMTGAGSLLWIIAIGALVYFMMKKGGGCCGGGGGHDHNKDQDEVNKEQPKGGCCG